MVDMILFSIVPMGRNYKVSGLRANSKIPTKFQNEKTMHEGQLRRS